MVTGPLETISLAALQEGKVSAGLEARETRQELLAQRELQWTGSPAGSRLETAEESGPIPGFPA